MGYRRKMNKIVSTLVGIVALVSFAYPVLAQLNLAPMMQPAKYEIEAINKPSEEVEKTEQIGEIEQLIKRVPESLWRISYCETNIRHKVGGKTIRGVVDNRDRGLLQINMFYHNKSAVARGFELNRLDGNIGYGILLYQEQGATPWKWSYNPKEDQCVNGLKMPPRESQSWIEIKTKAINALIASEKEV